MTTQGSVRAFFRIFPGKFWDGPRLYFAYSMSLLLKSVVPSRFGSVGAWIRGRRNLRVSLDGLRHEVRPRTNDLDLISRKHEPVTTKWFRVEPNDVVVDVGAHIGRYTLMAATKASKVVAVEPDPSNFRLLETNVALNGFTNVVLIPGALSSSRGTRLLRLAGRVNTGISSISENEGSPGTVSNGPAQVRVQTDTLDHLVEVHGLVRIDWLKIDVEGHEVDVLRGGLAALKITRRLMLEVTDQTQERCGTIVRSAGFEFDAIEEGGPARNWLMSRRGEPRSPAAGKVGWRPGSLNPPGQTP